MAHRAWSVLRGREDRGELLVVLEQIPTKTAAVAKTDRLRR